MMTIRNLTQGKITMTNRNLYKTEQYIKQLCSTINVLSPGKVRADDFLKPLREEMHGEDLIQPLTDNKCPCCGSEELEGHSFDAEGNNLVGQKMHCNACASEWYDQYTMTTQQIIDNQAGPDSKTFNVQNNIGKAKYTVNYHDGEKTHADGSPFFDIAIFKSKVKLANFLDSLRNLGYSDSLEKQ